MPATITSHRPRPLTAALLVAALATLLATVLGPFAAPSTAAPAPAATTAAPGASGLEADFLRLTNSSRGSNGLGALTEDTKAAEVARAWSQHMASTGSLAHNPNLASQVNTYVTRDWTRIGENVGVGWSASSLHDAFMNSAGHRANVLGDFNRVGIGTAVEGGGRIWVTLVFIKGPAIAPPSSGNLPNGNVDIVRSGPGTIDIYGWAADRDIPSQAVSIHLYANGGWAGSLVADQGRPDIAAALPWAGPNHGWSTTLSVGRGVHRVCAYALDASGHNPLLGCRDIAVGGASFGSLDGLAEVPGGYQVNGWAIDPDTQASVDVHLYANGQFAGWDAAMAGRPDVAGSYPPYGEDHGYVTRASAPHGWVHLCAYAIDERGGDANRQLACVDRYRDARPRGNFESGVGRKGFIDVSGWTLDPDTTAPTTVHVYVDGGWAGMAKADQNRDDIAGAFPGFGAGHGWSTHFTASPGRHTVCAYALDLVTAVQNPVLGCKLVDVPG